MNIKTLVEDYRRRAATAKTMHDTDKNSGSINDVKKFERLTIKAIEFRNIADDLEKLTLDDSNCKTVLDVINLIPQQSQVQYDLEKQLQELRIAANKLGLYDAADFLRPKDE
jgi:predicted Zn-dependent peptidase